MNAVSQDEHMIQTWPGRTKTGRPGANWLQIVTAIVFAIAAFFVSFELRAQSAAPVSPGQMKSGSLLLKDGNDFVEAPRLGADYDLTVSGPTLRGRVTQIFHNNTQNWVEAVYVYPLSEDGAVDTLKMVIGDRVIVGEIKERKSAREIYEQARASGHRATLIEQERPNIFTNSVANIAPGETVLVQIEYQAPVRQSNNTFSLRIPLVVAPRYNPQPVTQTVDFKPGGNGWGTANDPVPDRDRITSPVLDPRVNPPVNPVQITVRLQSGFPLADVKSHHHKVKTQTISADNQIVTLEESPVAADRDFELTWASAAGAVPAVGLFRERVGNDDYLLAFVTPPALEQTQAQLPREAIFVIDNSGSMGGTSMVQAKQSLLFALRRLKPADRFNVVRFDNTMETVFPDTVPARAENVARAAAFVSALEARGGTEMVPALKAALNDPRGQDSQFIRQVVFLTDGAIGNEQQLLDTMTAMLGRSRVFMVGIGSAPNSYLMTRASEIGRGTFTHIGSVDQVEQRMVALFEKLESPAVTSLSVAFTEAKGDITPAAIPDLYRGEPLVLAAKMSALTGAIEIKGNIGGRPWSVSLPLANAAEGKGLSKVWARRKIADAEVAKTLRRATPAETDDKITALGLEHQLVTRLTSLVAVDKTPNRPDGTRLSRVDMPLNLPNGWDFDKVFGTDRPTQPQQQPNDRAQTAPNPQEQRDANAASPLVMAKATRGVSIAAAPGAVAGAQPAPVASYQYASRNVALPKTATDAELRMMIGLTLLALSLLIFAATRFRIARS